MLICFCVILIVWFVLEEEFNKLIGFEYNVVIFIGMCEDIFVSVDVFCVYYFLCLDLVNFFCNLVV